MDLADMIIAFAKDFSAALWQLLWVLGAVVGTLYVGAALLRLVRASRGAGQGAVTIADILPVALVGALLFNLSAVIDRAWNSLGSGSVSYAPIAYASGADGGKLADAVNAVLTIASVAGGCFFFRGLLLLKQASMTGQSAQGADDLVWRALTHMGGGVCLVQVAETIDRFRQSFHLFW